MATHTINSDRTTPWKINQDNDTWTLGTNAKISVQGQPAVVIGTGFDKNTVNINGDIRSTDGEAIGVMLQGERTTINIGAKSEIKAVAGIYGDGYNATINNKGEIDGSVYGIYATSSAHVKNSGDITGMNAVMIGDDSSISLLKGEFHTILENHKGGKIVGEGVGVVLTGEGKHTLLNDGFIAGGEAAVYVASGDAHVINHGRIDGVVVFRDGDDFLDTRKGKIHGEVHGESGNDTYVVSKAKIDIVEDFNEGYDTVKSDANYTLGDNIEHLTLIGKGNIDGVGNALNNTLRGNASGNTLQGLGGADILQGGKGADFLTGGTDSDTFVFYKGDGKDTITDFQHGSDNISLFNFTGDDDFFQIGNHMTDHGKDVWITYGNDTLVLKGVHEADLDAGDFNFPIVI